LLDKKQLIKNGDTKNMIPLQGDLIICGGKVAFYKYGNEEGS